MSSSAASHGDQGSDILELGPPDPTGSNLDTDTPSVQAAEGEPPTVPAYSLGHRQISANASATEHPPPSWPLAFLDRGIELPPIRTSPTEIHAHWTGNNVHEFLSKYAITCREVDPAILTLQTARDAPPGSVDTTQAMSVILDFCNMSSMMYVEARPIRLQDCPLAERQRFQSSYWYARLAHFDANSKSFDLLYSLLRASNADESQGTMSIIDDLEESREGLQRYEQLSFKLTSRYRDRDWHDCFPRWKLDLSSSNEGVKVVADEIQQVIVSEPLMATGKGDWRGYSR